MYNSSYSNKNIDTTIIEYIDFIKNKLIPKGNYGLIVTGIRIFHLLLSICAIIGWLIPPSYKKLTILYMIGLTQAIIFYVVLKNSYLSGIVNKLTDENNEKFIPIFSNLLISLLIVFWFISLNGYLNPEYAAFTIVKKYM